MTILLTPFTGDTDQLATDVLTFSPSNVIFL